MSALAKLIVTVAIICVVGWLAILLHVVSK